MRVRHLRGVLIGQPLEDAPGGMPLLARRGQVLPQHLIDPPGHRLPDRRGPHRDFPIRWHRRRDRLPHRPAVHVILARQRPDRHPVALPVEADRREQLHSLLHPAPPDQEEHPTKPPSAQPPQMSRNTPGVSSATPTRWGQIRRELPPSRYSRWGQIKGEQWGHFRVLRPGPVRPTKWWASTGPCNPEPSRSRPQPSERGGCWFSYKRL